MEEGGATASSDSGIGGVVSTAANLVFQVTPQGRLRAYTADKGERLLDLAIGETLGLGPPITYMHNGKQYIAVMTGDNLKMPEFGNKSFRQALNSPTRGDPSRR